MRYFYYIATSLAKNHKKEKKKKKKRKITGEDAKHPQLSQIVSRNGKWYSHLTRQLGSAVQS